MRTPTVRSDSAVPLATSEDVAAAADAAHERRRIGIDTEFMSEGRYRALLCLVQIAVDDPTGAPAPRIDLIDSFDRIDVTPVAQLLADPSIEVVLHAGRQDVAILRRAWSTEITNVFDTQLSAGFVGASAQTGYGNLLGSMLGRRVGKTASYTRWDARPLSDEQLSYAAEDVAHLLELADEVQRRLQETGRLTWAREDRAGRLAAAAPRPSRDRARRWPTQAAGTLLAPIQGARSPAGAAEARRPVRAGAPRPRRRSSAAPR